MANADGVPSPSAAWLPPRAFWRWVLLNVPAAVFCYFWLATYLWSLGESYTEPWCPVPSIDYLIFHGDEFVERQLLFAGVPALLYILLLVLVVVWRRLNLTYVLGAIAGLLLGTFQQYQATLDIHFGGPVMHPLSMFSRVCCGTSGRTGLERAQVALGARTLEHHGRLTHRQPRDTMTERSR